MNVLMSMTIIIACMYQKQQHEMAISKHQIVGQKQQVKQYNKETSNINEEEKSDKKIDIQADKPVSLGEFRMTAYCPCEECCGKWADNRPDGVVYGAIGEELKEGYSIAVDPDIIPYRSKVVIDGQVYKAQDCGGAIKGNRIDVYFEDHNDALEFGVQHKEVFVNL